MNVFSVTDPVGNKLKDAEIIDYIKKCLESEQDGRNLAGRLADVVPLEESMSIELTGADRPGLLSEVCVVLTSLGCNIVRAEVWTHNRHAAAIMQITDEATGRAVGDAGVFGKVLELRDQKNRFWMEFRGERNGDFTGNSEILEKFWTKFAVKK